MKALAGQPRAARSRRPNTFARMALGLTSVCLLLCGGSTRGQEPTAKVRKTEEPYLRVDPQRVFRLETEATLRERMAREGRLGINPLNLKYEIVFPDYPAAPKEEYVPRRWPALAEIVEPALVCYKRLYFEQLNFERYGWDLGAISPFLSQGAFYFDLISLPYHAATEPFRRYECNAGYYLPGDPVPLLLYPQELSWTGALAEAAVIGLGFVIFP
jgi:hypothetical protein